MADRRPPEHPGVDVGGDADAPPDRQTAPRTPRWVLVFGVIAVIVILVVAVQLLLGVQHGPGMHGPSGMRGELTVS